MLPLACVKEASQHEGVNKLSLAEILRRVNLKNYACCCLRLCPLISFHALVFTKQAQREREQRFLIAVACVLFKGGSGSRVTEGIRQEL